MKKIIINSLFIYTFLIISFPSKAEPWVDTSNIFLRADLQLLADEGHLNVPLTTYPIMWADITSGLRNVNPVELSEESKNAYWHVKQLMRRAKKGHNSFQMNMATDEKRFTSFGDEFRDANTITSSFGFMGDFMAAKISTTAVEDPRDDENINWDGSYIAFYLGNWVFSVGAYDRWWGPGLDTTLALSNNAKPMPSIALTRKSSAPFVMPFFNDIKIPWNVTTFMGQMEEERHVPNALLWGFRMNFKLTQKLEVGVTRTAQWAGDDRPSSFDTFVDVLLGNDNCGEEFSCGEGRLEEEPGNQMAGYDLRYSRPFDWPVSIYYQIHAEDGSGEDYSFISKKVDMFGLETRVNMFDNSWLAFIEYADTYLDCTLYDEQDNGIDDADCLYEHHIYETGMRYKQRALCNIYENDSESIVLGLISQLNSLESWEIKLRFLDLNYDNSDKYPDNPDLGNTLTKRAEYMTMLSVKYQLRKGKFKYTVGSSLSHSSYDDDLDDDIEPNMYFNVEMTL